jgi:hypothetical protein
MITDRIARGPISTPVDLHHGDEVTTAGNMISLTFV